MCILVFTAALFARTKKFKQPKYPLRDEWRKKTWYTYTMEYYSPIKKNKIMEFVPTWIDLEIFILSEVSQAKKSIIYNHTCGI